MNNFRCIIYIYIFFFIYGGFFFNNIFRTFDIFYDFNIYLIDPSPRPLFVITKSILIFEYDLNYEFSRNIF